MFRAKIKEANFLPVTVIVATHDQICVLDTLTD